MIKIIFSDFDNTMLDYYSNNNYFDNYKIGVLREVQNKGIKFCIVTGRSVSFFKQFPNLLKVIDYIMGSNGACIYDVKNDKYIHNDVIGDNEFKEVVKYLLSKKQSFLLNCLDKRYKYGIWDATDCLEYVDGNKYLCDQIILGVVKEEFQKLFNYLESIDNVKINNMSCWTDYWTVDINKTNVSKGNSVFWLCNHLGISVNDALVFGDGDNDKSMFEIINKGVTVGNAIDKLKVLSKDVALDCKDNGIYKYIEDNILR